MSTGQHRATRPTTYQAGQRLGAAVQRLWDELVETPRAVLFRLVLLVAWVCSAVAPLGLVLDAVAHRDPTGLPWALAVALLAVVTWCWWEAATRATRLARRVRRLEGELITASFQKGLADVRREEAAALGRWVDDLPQDPFSRGAELVRRAEDAADRAAQTVGRRYPPADPVPERHYSWPGVVRRDDGREG